MIIPIKQFGGFEMKPIRFEIMLRIIFFFLLPQLLLAHFQDPEKDSPDWFLFWGLYNQDTEVVRDALSLGADPNARSGGNHALFVAATKGDTTAIVLLLKAGADINLKTMIAERTALHEAVLKSKIDAVRLLVSMGADINAVNKFGRTPLYYATNPPFPLSKPKDSEFLIKYLMQHGGKL